MVEIFLKETDERVKNRAHRMQPSQFEVQIDLSDIMIVAPNLLQSTPELLALCFKACIQSPVSRGNPSIADFSSSERRTSEHTTHASCEQ